tara:strand:+ start:55 stop:615 length:561 start_codon:yes stop_codon:yes gene_type:complete
MKNITHKEKVLIEFLLGYYRNNIDLFCDIINQKTKLSLRLLDWLVTNYSKKYNIIYPLQLKNGDIKYFNIYLDYKNQLKAYSKKHFDPFCRQGRIVIDTETLRWNMYDKKQSSPNQIITTVGQMNFFRWVIENKIFEFAVANINLIDKDMYNTLDFKDKEKRKSLSPSATKGGVYNNMHKITIKFR